MRKVKRSIRKPTHPGLFLRLIVVPTTGLTQNEIAERIAVSRNTVSGVLNGRIRVTVDLAAKLGRLFNLDAGTLLHMQIAWDLWQIENHSASLAFIQPVCG